MITLPVCRTQEGDRQKAFADQAACERDRRDTIASEKKDFGDISQNPGTVLYEIDGKNMAIVPCKCIPDTIDPRAPHP